jgi:hypothetical protein
MSTVTAELKFVSPQYFADVVKAKDAEIERLRKALGALSSATYDVVSANRSVEMSGTRYRNPTIAKLAAAMFDANKALDGSAESESEGKDG